MTYCYIGHAMTWVVGCHPLTMEAWVQSQATQCEICGRQSGAGTRFSLSTSLLFCQYHYASAVYWFIYLLLMLYYCRNWHMKKALF